MLTSIRPLGRAPRGTMPPVLDRARLSADFDRALAAIEARWPDAPVRDDAFATYVRAHLDRSPDLAASFTESRLVDLFTVWWAMQSPAGVAAFLDVFGPSLAHAIAWVTGRFGHLDPRSLMEHLLAELFAGAEPRAREFAGRGSLRAWLDVVATQAFLDRAHARH